MDRRPHDYAAASAMAYAQQQRQAPNIQQQQQYGFHQHQQFPPSAHAPPFIPSHPSLQQFPYHHHMQQQQQLHPHPPSPQMIGVQQQQQPLPGFAAHLPPHHVSSPFVAPYDSAPPPSAPPSDPELQKRIDKLVEYAAKNGPEFEAMIREKQQDNPEYSFLFGGEGHNYYKYKHWLSTRFPGSHFNPSYPPPSMPMMHPTANSVMNPSGLHAPMMNPAVSAVGALGGTQMHRPPFPSFYEQQQHHQLSHPFVGHGHSDYDQGSNSFKGLSGPLPSDVAMELNNVISNLNGTKESIKSAKIWFMQRSPFAPALAEALKDRVFSMADSERQLHIVYLANDILFDSLQRRMNPHELDNEALAFKPVLGPMLAKIFHNPQNNEENQLRLQKILQFWASKEVYDQDTIYAFEGEMMAGPPVNTFPGPPREMGAGMMQQPANHYVSQWQPDQQGSVAGITDQLHPDRQTPQTMTSAIPNQQFLPNSVSSVAFPGSMPLNSSTLPANPLPAPTLTVGEKLPPYPLFPPGLIPGMVRKMQIGSGVPYSPLSPLDIPTVIPLSDVSQSEILERVSKFFKEIGEVNPSEGPMSSDSKDEDDEYEREAPIRKGGACIPPPANMQLDSETGTYPDGSVERKPGSSSSGRLGLGATADPNEVSQYDDVYSSYRKHRSTNYHSSMSARAATR